jgi:hypothetical protein
VDPIYSQLLTELEAALQLAGHRYDRLAEARLIHPSTDSTDSSAPTSRRPTEVLPGSVVLIIGDRL